MKKILSYIMCLSIICIILAGCGDGGGNVPVSGGSSQYGLLKEGGFYRNLVMSPNGDFWVRNKVKETDAKKGLVYKVELNKDNKVEKISSLFGGTPINTKWRDIKNSVYDIGAITVEYEDGYVKYNFKNARNNAIRGFYGAYSIRYKISDGKTKKIAYLYNKNGEQSLNLDYYSQMLFTYDDKGNLFKVGYANVNGERITTRSMHYETRIKYDADKRNIFPKEISNYGKDDSLMVDNTGIARTTYTFDKNGRLIEARHYGTDETLKEKKININYMDVDVDYFSAGVITKYFYDENKTRPKKIAFYGKDEQPVAVHNWGKISSLSFTYSEDGMLTSIKALGTDDTAVSLSVDELGDKVVEMRAAHDEFGNVVKISLLGKEGNMIVAPKLNCAEIRLKYDDKRRETETAYYGTGEEKINASLLGRGVHRVVTEYDDDDEITEKIYYDKDDNVVKRDERKGNKKNEKKPSTTNSSGKGIITGTEVRIRSGASTESGILGYFNKGETVDILDTAPGWIKVKRSNGTVGWVSSQFCSIK